MIDVECENILRGDISDIGFWLDQNMPNPPEPEPQRWTLGYSVDGRVGIRFAENTDATLFLLRWA